MRLRLVEADETWDELNTAKKVAEFEKYFNSRTPPFNTVQGEKEFDRRNITDVNTYITNVFSENNIGGNLKNSLTKSIQEQGINPADNAFLSFLVSVSGNDALIEKLTEEKADLIRNQLKNGELDKDSETAKKWLTNANAYDGSKYKIQALLLLSDEDDVENYMDPGENNENVNSLIDKVLNLRNDNDIRQLLDNAQTRHGEPRHKYGKGSKSGNNTTSLERLIKLINALIKDEGEAKKYANKVFNPKETEASLLHKAAELIAKDKNIDLNGEEKPQEETPQEEKP